MTDLYITTAIPYVNGAPHLGFATELLQADVLARHARARGCRVWFQTGTDEHSLKNVRAAHSAGCAPTEFVRVNAAQFSALRGPLNLSYDGFVRTSADPRHRPAVERLWRACAAAGDLYRRRYRGLYCVGCEQFVTAADLVDGVCPEHGRRPELVDEDNWFFRLSRYQGHVERLLDSGRLHIEPAHEGRALRQFLATGLKDISVSRSATRAQGWGVPVPGDPEQVVYVWFDALTNYLSGLDYADDGPAFDRYWRGGGDRVHVLGKGVSRFHGVYWPAFLESAGLPAPTHLFVHAYVTVSGHKIGKSLGNALDPVALVARYGTDALRYFLLRYIRTTSDGDFREARLATAIDADLVGGLGNLVRRVTTLLARNAREPWRAPDDDDARAIVEPLSEDVDAEVSRFRLHRGLEAVFAAISKLNRWLTERAPWTEIRSRSEARRAAGLRTLKAAAEALRHVAHQLAPFLPTTSTRILNDLGLEHTRQPTLAWGGQIPVRPATVGPVLFVGPGPVLRGDPPEHSGRSGDI